eukprot:3532392-Prymnesium_polylepis.1
MKKKRNYKERRHVEDTLTSSTQETGDSGHIKQEAPAPNVSAGHGKVVAANCSLVFSCRRLHWWPWPAALQLLSRVRHYTVIARA